MFSLSSCFFSSKKFAKEFVFTCFWTFFFEQCRFLFDFLDLLRSMFPLQKMFSLPLYFLLSFILFPSVLVFCLLLFSRFFHLFHPFMLNFLFFGLFVISVSSCKTLCQKKCIFSDCNKTLFFCLLFFIMKKCFLCFLFCWAYFYIDLCFIFSLSWKMVPHFVSLFLFFDYSF